METVDAEMENINSNLYNKKRESPIETLFFYTNLYSTVKKNFNNTEVKYFLFIIKNIIWYSIK